MSRFPIVAAVVALLSGALTIVLWSIELRWVAVLLLAWCALFGLALFRQLAIQVEKLFLYTFVLAYSIRMDVHVVQVGNGYGFPLSLGDVWCFLLMVMWVFRRRRDRIPVEWPRRFVIPFVLLFLGALISVVQTPDWPTRCRMPLFVLQSELLFLYLWNMKLTPVDYRRLAVGVGIAIAIQGIIGGLQGVTRSSLGLEFFGASSATVNTTTFTSFSRVGGTIGQPNRFAMFINAVIFIPAAMVFLAKTPRGRLAYALTFAAAFGALIMSQSRGAWLGFAIAFVPFVYFALRERLSRLHSALTLGWMLGLGLAFVLLFPPTYERLTAEDQSSAFSRIPMAQTALAMIEDNPFGVGFTQYVARMSRYDVTEDGLSYRFRFPVHNGFLLLAAEQGVWVLLVYFVFIVAFYALLFRLLKEAPRFPRLLGLGCGAGMIAIHVQSNVEIANLVIAYYEWFVMGMAANVLLYLQRTKSALPEIAPAGIPAVAGVTRSSPPSAARGDGRRRAAAAPTAAAGRSGLPGAASR